MGTGQLRNKPCKCGSGKKYKYCCLVKQIFLEKDTFNKNSEEKLGEILDEAMSQYLSNENVIWKNESEKDKNYYEFVSSNRRNWSESKACIFPECNKESVRKSHTIQKTAISLISEDNHVLSPQFCHRTGNSIMVKMSINRASTFPGFCEEHENVFNKFEKEGVFKDSTEYALQMFRTICREIRMVLQEN